MPMVSESSFFVDCLGAFEEGDLGSLVVERRVVSAAVSAVAVAGPPVEPALLRGMFWGVRR